MRSEFQANAVSTTREKCLVRKLVQTLAVNMPGLEQAFYFFDSCSKFLVFVEVKYFVNSQSIYIHAIILGIVLGSNETTEIFAIPRELTCSLEMEDKELETWTFSISTRNISEAKIAFWDLHRKDSIIEIHIYILFSLQLQLTVLRLPRKHATGRIFEKQKDRSQLGHSFCFGRGFDRCHTVLGKQRHRAQQHNNVYCADSRRI